MNSKPERDYVLDSFRGLMLIMMLLDHSKLFFSDQTYQPFGLFSSAEGFFYLSGFVFGMVYSKYLTVPGKLWSKSLRRIKTMYIYYLVTFFILFAEHLTLRTFFGIELYPTWTMVQQSFWIHLIRFTTFTYYPYLFPVIPMYILFFFFSPWVLQAYHRKKAWIPISIACSILILMNVLKNPWFYIDIFNNEHLSFVFRIFNPLSWQLLFVAGIYFGYRRFKGIPLKYPLILIIACSIFCAAMMVLRRLPDFPGAGYYHELAGSLARSILSPLRLINFFAFAYLLSFLIRNLRFKERNFMAFLGAYSIDVFMFHIILIHNLRKFGSHISSLNPIIHILIAILLVGSLSLPAYIRDHQKNRAL